MAFLPGEIDDRPTFPPAIPHFFKIILNDTSRDKKIKIPPKFVTKYGDNMSNPVFFKVPSGLEWKIELRKWDGEVWFENGWQDFSSFYSLDYGHLLVFGYEGNSKFRVLILERSCTEIEYPLQNTAEKTDEDEKSSDDSHDTSYHESGDDSDVGSVEIGENHTPCPRKTREKSLLPGPRPRKKNRPSSRGKTNVPATSAKATALERASGFKSDRHPPLKVAMTRTYIYIDATRVCHPSLSRNTLTGLLIMSSFGFWVEELGVSNSNNTTPEDADCWEVGSNLCERTVRQLAMSVSLL